MPSALTDQNSTYRSKHPRTNSIVIRDENRSKQEPLFKHIQDTKRGKSLDMQNELRSFYQTVRDSDVCYTTIQTKNPFTMLWATNPSPTRHV